MKIFQAEQPDIVNKHPYYNCFIIIIMKYILFISFLLVSVSCSKDKQEDKLTSDIFFQMVVSVPWEVNLFVEDDNIETSDFEGYTFTFLVTNKVKATKGTDTYEGTWYVIEEENKDSEIGITFNIAFTAPDRFVSLTEDWGVITATQEMIRLKHTSGGDGSTDYLTFTN